MFNKPAQRFLLLSACVLLTLLLSACGEWQPVSLISSTPQASQQVDSLFENYYRQQGGSEQLGPVISGIKQEGARQCQYTTKGVMCYDSQAADGSAFSFVSVVTQSNYSSPFQKVLDRMGGTEVFGQPLAEPTIAADGNMEQVYNNVVVYSPPDNPNAIRFRPLSKILNMPMSQPGQKVYDRRHNVIFYPVQGELGYHVPIVFDEFIAQHGGTEKSGQPISEPAVLDLNGERVARQCFENYCLDYYATAAPGKQTRMAPLGASYQTVNTAIPGSYVVLEDTLSMLVSEDKTQILSTETQTFYLLVYSDHTKEPRPNVNATLEILLPGGIKYSHEIPPTGPNGWTKITVPPPPNVSHGTMVAYKICLAGEADTCVSESYLVWNYR